MTSSIDPTTPATNSPLYSAAIRSNFQAAYNDINALYAAINSGVGGFSSVVPVERITSSGLNQALSFPATGNAAYDVTLSANCAFTIAGGISGQLQTLTLILRQDSTAGRVPTLPTGVKWSGGSAPTPNSQAGKIDVFVFRTPDAGTTVFGGYQ